MRSDERNEPHGGDFQRLDPIALPLRDHELLLRPIADRNEQPSALGELLEQRLRHRRRTRANEDRVVRRVLAPADGSVAQQQRDVSDALSLDRSRACCISAGMRSIENTCATRCASSTV